MKVIDAFWDTRSLGVKTGEIEFQADDMLGDFQDVLHAMHTFQYIAAKVPTGRMDIVEALEDKGFAFAECSIELLVNLDQFELSGISKRFASKISCQKANEATKSRIYKEIEKGIFDTDRIFLDPKFANGLAAKRYINWIEDELARGGDVYHVYYKDQEAGFFSYKEPIPGVEAWPFLAGLYDGFKTSGLGANIVVGIEAEEAKRRGCSRIRTYVSSNNMPILRIHQMLGYTINDIRYVFTRHIG